MVGTANEREASAHETNKAFDRYYQFQNDTAFKMAGLLKKERYYIFRGRPKMIDIVHPAPTQHIFDGYIEMKKPETIMVLGLIYGGGGGS